MSDESNEMLLALATDDDTIEVSFFLSREELEELSEIAAVCKLESVENIIAIAIEQFKHAVAKARKGELVCYHAPGRDSIFRPNFAPLNAAVHHDSVNKLPA